MISGPPSGRALHAGGTHSGQVDLQGKGCLIRSVCPKTMVSSRNAEPAVEIVEDSERGRLPAKRGEVGANTAHERDEDDEVGV